VKLLVLGGTKFLGRAVVEAALARGHDVTIFNRGVTNPELFPTVERLIGDRDGNLSALESGTWDSVVDTSGYVPRVVRDSTTLLAARADHHTFVSSISAYRDLSVPPREGDPVATLADETVEELGAEYENYGGLKALCEREVERAFPSRALIVRPGLIVGPHDPTDRFTYWPRRVWRGGEILAPGPPERRVQFIDVRDLADWMVHAAEERLTGTFNAVNETVPLAELLTGAKVTWVDDAFLHDHGVDEWMEIPLWIADLEHAGMLQADVSRAVGAGLRFRPVAETMRDTADWDATRGDYEPQAGLAPEREADLLEAWRAKTPA
jgi:2'-hydroxyisoflavone reductase